MKKITTLLFCGLASCYFYGQWQPIEAHQNLLRKEVKVNKTYRLNLQQIKNTLEKAPLEKAGAKPVEVYLPDTEGVLHRFAVYSRPVAEKTLAERYGLGSYVGFGVDDPSLLVRFSLTGKDFQSMLFKDGAYQFIEALDQDKTVYGVFGKTIKNKTAQAFECSTYESKAAKAQLENLMKPAKAKNGKATWSRFDNRVFRTYRLALAVTGEYGALYGGVEGALAQMNATMTRVNGIYEKDLALNLIMIDKPEIIYTDAATDPFSNSDKGADGEWSMELQKTLTSVVGEQNYDIGHLFGHAGGGGNAGCIGCVCQSPRTNASGIPIEEGKGAAYTSPAYGLPQGDAFDVDFVAHEFGHQLGANHTFSHALHTGLQTHVEPGSGSTIMGYAGITNADVQSHSDAYFHTISIGEILTNLANKNCAQETSISNTAPVITPLPDVTIPKGTAFVLTAKVEDAENLPLSYTWEQVDAASSPITTVTGNNSSGALFRSLPPSNSPTRYFPKLSSVLQGKLTIPSDWETVSNIARKTNFTITVRDHHPDAKQQQVQSTSQSVTVHENGPFKLLTSALYTDANQTLLWDVVGTDQSPFNVSNVKIDYTTDEGSTWTVLKDSTPNNGRLDLDASALPKGEILKIRVSAIGNIFYAIGSVEIKEALDCVSNAALSVEITDISSNSAIIAWNYLKNAVSHTLKYRKKSEAQWHEVQLTDRLWTLSGLEDSQDYEVQVETLCSAGATTLSPIVSFSTASISYCASKSIDSDYEYIGNVTVTPEKGTVMSNNSKESNYSDYTGVKEKAITLYRGTSANKISVTKRWTDQSYNEAVKAWIDFNRDGVFSDSEIILNSSLSKTTPVTATFSVPETAYAGEHFAVMRVIMSDASITNACDDIEYGEVEDYAVYFTNENLSTASVSIKENQIRFYPNPVTDVLNISNAPSSAKYKIYNTAGQIVTSGALNDGKIRLSTLEKGVYILSLEDQNEEVIQHKFIKQ
ncbi:reprolysin-like metallopeptidase [Bergeyella sp. RCAD1439]|uniref:reprolysin-like metallopeptidase n=1 Tax=Bergeyella anatis TaxID=3113737 RepID=UPI002E19DAA1|nr:zinc-dependent metalloprotease family protein [Bergeyella sp. RCAD1439]